MSVSRLSVVVPSYNQGVFLSECLNSLREQQFPNLEVIVIDGASHDNSVEVIRRNDDIVNYWVSEPDEGQTHALQKGFARASGEVLCWLNSDDVLLPGAVTSVMARFAASPEIDVLYGDAKWIGMSGQTLRYQREMPFCRFVWLNTYNYLPGMSVFWRRQIFKKVGGLDSRFNLAMDADLWIRFSDAGARIVHVREYLSAMRFYATQKNQRLRQQSDEEDRLIRSRYYPGEHEAARRVRRIIAKACRVGWRLTTGCYDRTYRVNLAAKIGSTTR